MFFLVSYKPGYVSFCVDSLLFVPPGKCWELGLFIEKARDASTHARRQVCRFCFNTRSSANIWRVRQGYLTRMKQSQPLGSSPTLLGTSLINEPLALVSSYARCGLYCMTRLFSSYSSSWLVIKKKLLWPRKSKRFSSVRCPSISQGMKEWGVIRIPVGPFCEILLFPLQRQFC